MPNFPIPQNMMNKTRKYCENWKRCNKCEYVTATTLLRCPCCKKLYRTRTLIDKEYRDRQRHIPIHLRKNVTILEERNTFNGVRNMFRHDNK